MSRVVSKLAVAVGLLLAATSVRAQTESPITIILTQAQNALNDLKYARVDTLARQVLTNPRATTLQVGIARMLLAAAAYPEDAAPNSRRAADALGFLRDAIRTDIDLTLPNELRWSGLDSLMGVAKRTGFGIGMKADSQQVIVGPTGLAQVAVRATKPTAFRLMVSPSSGGEPLVTDSIAPTTSGALHFATMANARPLFPTGDYLVTVVGRDPESRDSIVIRETAHIVSPDLQLATPPTGIDSTKLLPEHGSRTGAKGIFNAIWVGGGVYALSNLLVADSTPNANPKKKFGPDSKGIPIAVAVSGAVIVFSFLDHGRTLPANVVANKQLHEDLAKSITAATADNVQRINAYRTTIMMRQGGGGR